jgi:HTH-type transcriptional regulator/antitoxin HigA
VRIVTEKPIREFIEREPRSADAMWHWVDSIGSASWRNPGEMKWMFASASFVGGLTVFNVGGNRYRIAAFIQYRRQIVYIKRIGTHEEYDKWDLLTASIDLKRYGRLLAKTVPRVIASEEENERAIAIVESLMEKGESNMTPEEDALLDLLTNLIRDYEASAYPARPKSTAHQLVAFLLEQRELKPNALWPVIGSKGRVSEILAGKRPISKEQAKKLAEFFRVRADLFL